MKSRNSKELRKNTWKDINSIYQLFCRNGSSKQQFPTQLYDQPYGLNNSIRESSSTSFSSVPKEHSFLKNMKVDMKNTKGSSGHFLQKLGRDKVAVDFFFFLWLTIWSSNKHKGKMLRIVIIHFELSMKWQKPLCNIVSK